MNVKSPRIYPLAAAGATAFIIWGSLFPFEFRAVPFAEARELFWNSRALVLDVAAWSFTDVVSNAALFVPFGLFVSAARAHSLSRSSLIPVVLASLMLSASLEFGQAFVPWRAPSFLDVAASAAGAVAGGVLWRIFQTGLDTLALTGERMWDASTGAERGLLLYSFMFACAWLMPFDVTIRPGEIKDKYQHQRLLLPRSTSPDAASPARLALILMAAIPVGIAFRVCLSPRGVQSTAGRAVTAAGLLLVVLEIAQVTVFSRTTDTTELLVALPGVALGAHLAPLRSRSSHS